MKLAEALQERADLNRKIEQLRERLMNNALVQEGERTAENPDELLAELDLAVGKLEKLMANINHTNSVTIVDDMSLTSIIARKDALSLQLNSYRDIIAAASRIIQRATRNEIRILPAVDVRALQMKADKIAKEIRMLDNRLQENNWKTELIEL